MYTYTYIYIYIYICTYVIAEVLQALVQVALKEPDSPPSGRGS